MEEVINCNCVIPNGGRGLMWLSRQSGIQNELVQMLHTVKLQTFIHVFGYQCSYSACEVQLSLFYSDLCSKM